MKIKKMIMHNNLLKMKTKILPTHLQENCRQFKRIWQYIIYL